MKTICAMRDVFKAMGNFETAFEKMYQITFSPQKVKKMVTFCPVAAAPFASTKVAKALSKSSLNMMKVFPLPSHEVTILHDFGSPFSITTIDFPPEVSFEIN